MRYPKEFPKIFGKVDCDALVVRFAASNAIGDAETNAQLKAKRYPMTQDKQLRDIKLATVLEKRRLGQALNIKEFAVLAGVSYSVAREWVQLPGFPRFEGVVFWNDFESWRNDRNCGNPPGKNSPHQPTASTSPQTKKPIASDLPPRAARILQDSVK